MRTPNKSRSRNKNNNRRPNQIGNVVNRVFDSNGPEGRVRGTPNQIIEKYQSLAQDATLSGNRVESENFSQHAEHYIRMLAEAQAELNKEQAMRQAEQDARMNEQQRNRPEPEVRAEAEEKSLDHQIDNAEETEENSPLELNDPRDEKPKKFRRPPMKRRDESDPRQSEPHVSKFDENNAPDFLKSINE